MGTRQKRVMMATFLWSPGWKICMYAKCERLLEAECLFDGVACKSSNHVSWSTMITGYMRNGDGDGAMKCFRDITRHGIEPNQYTFPCVLATCADASASGFGVQVHCCILKSSSLGQNAFVQSALVNVYVKRGDMSSATALIDTMEIKDVVSWNSMIVGSASQGFVEEALALFRKMHSQGTKMDDFMYPSVLKSSACVMDLRNSKSVHCTILKNSFGAYRLVSNVLIDMYSKQGDLASALEIFRHMSDRDVISWTSLVTGCTPNGFYEEAIRLFCEMKIAGVHPDDIVMVSILSSAAKFTLLQFGEQVHGAIYKSVYGTSTSVVNALVSLYAKCGCLEEASQIFDSMQWRGVITWTALIVGYTQNRKARNSVELYKQMISIEWMWNRMRPYGRHCSVLVGYTKTENWQRGRQRISSAGEFEDAARIRKLMKSKWISKEPGCSWITINIRIHSFASENRCHPKTFEIYVKVQEMMLSIKEAGYVFDMDYALHDTDREEKELGLAYHSEKLAIAFGLLYVSLGMPIRVFKNLRVCGDCHAAMRYISRVYNVMLYCRTQTDFTISGKGLVLVGITGETDFVALRLLHVI